MKRCKNRECKGYSQFVDDECTGCPICQGELDLVVESENSNINMGNANAISGGVHSSDDHSKKDSDNVVNSNNETHTNSHNTTNNTTIYEAEKSASEKLIENERAYRLKCKELIKDGLISKEGESLLREMQVCLNLPDELASPIREEIRLHSRRRKKQLTMTGMSDIRQTKSIIEQNTAPALQRQLEKLETWMQEYDDDTLKLMYYQMSSMLEPIRYTNRYEDGVKDEYWEIYWAYIAYLLQHREKQANEALASLGRWHADYPEQNDIILLLTGRLMQNEPMDDIQQVRNQLTAHFTSDLQLLLDAIDELLQMDWAKESIVIRPAHSFYVNTLFGLFVENQKAAGLQRLKEWREQERIKQEEEERIRLTELEQQKQIREQKTSVLQKLQEIGNVEIACQEAGIEFHTFNIWLEEDSTFASSYHEIVHRMEVRKSEEAERKRKAQVIEAETKHKKFQFKILFEQNKCDLLKTCSELGISSADYQEWRRVDSVFNDDMNYIIRKNKEYAEQQNREKRKEIFKKIRPFIIAAIVLATIVSGINMYLNNKESKAQTEEIKSYERKIDEFNAAYNLIANSPEGLESLSNACTIVLEMRDIEDQEHFTAKKQSQMYANKLKQEFEKLIAELTRMRDDPPQFEGDINRIKTGEERLEKVKELQKKLLQ